MPVDIPDDLDETEAIELLTRRIIYIDHEREDLVGKREYLKGLREGKKMVADKDRIIEQQRKELDAMRGELTSEELAKFEQSIEHNRTGSNKGPDCPDCKKGKGRHGAAGSSPKKGDQK